MLCIVSTTDAINVFRFTIFRLTSRIYKI